MANPHNRPIVALTYDDATRYDLEQEVAHRINQGLGNARVVYVMRDAILSAPDHIPLIPPPLKRDGPVHGFVVTFGPTLARRLESVDDDWKRAAFARSALRYYLDLPRSARPRNLLGSDVTCDPLRD